MSQRNTRHYRSFFVALCSLSVLSGVAALSHQHSSHAYILSRAPFTAAPQPHEDSIAPAKSAPIREALPSPDPLTRTVYPFAATPDWGAMRTPAEWNRTYEEIPRREWIPLPAYDLHILTRPLATMIKPLTPENIRMITTKLTYSTRFFGTYHLDSNEFTGSHAGIDIKMPAGTPVAAIGNGIVYDTNRSPLLGKTVLIQHRVEDATLYSVYGHLQDISVTRGDPVLPGSVIGTVGMTGSTSAPHLHLQIDREQDSKIYTPYRPRQDVTRIEALPFTVHPIEFIQKYLPNEKAPQNGA